MPVKIDVTITGPLFNGQGTQQNIRRWGRRMVQQVIEAGEQRLDMMLRPRNRGPLGVYLTHAEAGRGKASTGDYRRNVHGFQVGLFGRISDGGKVYGPWLEGTSSRNATTRFKGYRSFRQTHQWINKNKQKIIRPIINLMTKDLGG
jgi:hypothetical protein